jgi:hypothetical protein
VLYDDEHNSNRSHDPSGLSAICDRISKVCIQLRGTYHESVQQNSCELFDEKYLFTIFLGIFENRNLLSSFYTRKKNVFDGLQGGQKTMNVLQPMNICVVYTENILLK